MITFNLTAADFQINAISIKFPIEIKTLREIFKVADRKAPGTGEENAIYSWDELGVIAYSKDGNMVETLGLSLVLGEFDFSAREIFKGVFYFENEEIISYYMANEDKRVPLFDGANSYYLILNDIRVWFDLDNRGVTNMLISGYDAVLNNAWIEFGKRCL